MRAYGQPTLHNLLPVYMRLAIVFFVCILLCPVQTLFAQRLESISPINKKLGCLSVIFQDTLFGEDDFETFLVRLSNVNSYSRVIPFRKTLVRRRARTRRLRLLVEKALQAGDFSKVSLYESRLGKVRGLIATIRSCRVGALTNFDDFSVQPEVLPTESDACSIVGDNSPFFARIINGDRCAIGNSPVVEIEMYSNGSSAGGCTGTAISRRAVLTAAHCLPRSVTSVEIIAGGGSTRITSRQMFSHPQYNEFSSSPGANDVGVILLSRDLPTRVASVLPTNDIRIGEELVIAGYGLVDPNGNGKSNGFSTAGLQGGKMTISSYSNREIMSNFNISNGGANTCNGDSGGPGFVFRNGSWVLAAVTSYGFNQSCGPTDTSGFANVTAQSVKDFIRQYVAGVF